MSWSSAKVNIKYLMFIANMFSR